MASREHMMTVPPDQLRASKIAEAQALDVLRAQTSKLSEAQLEHARHLLAWEAFQQEREEQCPKN
jgi:hypothetical protein